MTPLIAGMLMGLGGSVHCAAMCGPLVALATGRPSATGTGNRATAWTLLLARSAWHHAGRVGVYAGLGVLSGSLGHLVTGTGTRSWLSLGAGLTLTIAAVLSFAGSRPQLRGRWQARMAGFIVRTGQQLRQRRGGRFAAGILNGFLPCGLLYMALVAAAGFGRAASACAFMTGFGLGSIPALMVVCLATGRGALHPIFRRASPVATALVGVMLVLRGLAIPVPGVHAYHDGSDRVQRDTSEARQHVPAPEGANSEATHAH